MPQTAHLEGPALRTLASSAGRTAFLPPEPAPASEKSRDRIWELAETLHCSIVGTCLTNADGRALLAKLGVPDARTMSEHRLHGQVVHLAARRDGGGKLLQKTLDRRYEREIRRFDAATTTEEVRALWRTSLESGEIPGAYWAALTHPATDWTLVQDIFGEVHMLSHLVGQTNRADIRRLRQLEADMVAREEKIAEQEARIAGLMEARDDLEIRNRALATAGARTAREPRREKRPEAQDAVSSLEARLAREQAHAEALEEKVAILMQASARLSASLEAETESRRAVEAELAAVEAMLGDADRDDGDTPDALRLDGRTLLYVGGRPRQVAHLRTLTEDRGGRLLSHDGGMEDSMTLLPGLVGQADLVVFPVVFVSHEATAMVKRVCEATGTAFRPLRSAGLASFVQALRSVPSAVLSVS